jgi:hypothetical protein
MTLSQLYGLYSIEQKNDYVLSIVTDVEWRSYDLFWSTFLKGLKKARKTSGFPHAGSSTEPAPSQCDTKCYPGKCHIRGGMLRVDGVAWSAQRILMAVNLGFLDRNRYFFIQAAPQLSSRGWVDLVPDSLLLRKSGRPGIEPGTSGSVARNLTARPQGRSAWALPPEEMAYIHRI